LILIGLSSLLFIKATIDFRSLRIEESQTTFKIAMAIALLGFFSGVL